MGENDTILETRVARLENDIAKNSEQHRKFYDKFAELEIKFAINDEKQTQILTSLGKIESKLETITDKPAKRWETIITAIITAVVSIGITLVFTLPK